MFRSYQTTLDTNGSGNIAISPDVTAVEWDCYQISVQLTVMQGNCEIRHNGFFLCSTSQGWKDTATGPPDIVILPRDILTVVWYAARPRDLATVGIWFNQNPQGSTTSLAH